MSTQTQVWELPRPRVHSHIIKAMRRRLIVCPRGDHIDPHVGPLVSFWARWSIKEPSGHTINMIPDYIFKAHQGVAAFHEEGVLCVCNENVHLS